MDIMNIKTTKGLGIKTNKGMNLKTTKGAVLKAGDGLYDIDNYAKVRKYLGTKPAYAGAHAYKTYPKVTKTQKAPKKIVPKPEPEPEPEVETEPEPEVPLPTTVTPLEKEEDPDTPSPYVSAVGSVTRMIFLFQSNVLASELDSDEEAFA